MAPEILFYVGIHFEIRFIRVIESSLMSGSFCGMLLCLISSLVLSLGTLMVANMKSYHPITKSFWRFLGTFLPAIVVVLYYVAKGKSIFRILWPIHTKKGFTIHISLLVSSKARYFDFTNSKLSQKNR